MQGLSLHEDQLKEMEENLRGMEFYSDHPGSHGFNWTSACCDKDIRGWKSKKGESLSDVLGDIPMSSVKSYKIRDTKYGKKMVIEVNDDFPMHHSEDVIVISRPRAPRIRVERPDIRYKYIIQKESDEDEDIEIEIELEEIEE